MTSRRVLYYAGASTAVAAACLLKAFHQRPNFYSATVYLSQSNACILILTNLLLVMACAFMYGLQRLLYGPLRPIEIEQLSEKAWYAVLDTLLAMPSFREDVGGWLLTMFGLLLTGKVWGWIAEGRVDILEQQPPANPRLFHARLATSLLASVAFDLYMLRYCCDVVIKDPRPGMMVIFTFEFALQSIFATFTLLRYGLSVGDTWVQKEQMKVAIQARKEEIRAERAAARQAAAQNTEGQGSGAAPAPVEEEPIEVDENEVDVLGWEEKRRYLFALEVLTDFIKLMLYIFFFAVSITFNGLPMHIMRDVYMTFASFSKRVGDYVAYRKATSDMNARYPDATVEEIRGDVCIICRETMVTWEQPDAAAQAHPAGDQPPAAPAAPARRRDEGLRAKKLPCGHILHLRCLKAWLERQQVCPTCRRPVVTAETPAAANGAALNQGQGQQGQQPAARRPGRGRIFNLGPIRIGFLNGPQEQVQNFINQMQNPNAAAANRNADVDANPDANQQGPNHLGLQAPYADPAATQTNSDRSRRPAGTSTPTTRPPVSIQLLQIEQRILQEAQNLALEQHQLTNLRMMEAELARLRAQRIPTQLPVGMTTAHAQRQMGLPQQPFPPQVPFMGPQNMGALFRQRQQHLASQYPPPLPNIPQLIEALHGDPMQQLPSGHETLPQGLVLPEGWTAMPLHRASAPAPAALEAPTPADEAAVHQHVSPASASSTLVELASSASAPRNTASLPASIPPFPTEALPAALADNGEGSPLFVPSDPAAAQSSPPSSSGLAAQAQSHANAPWTQPDWNFADGPIDGPGSASVEQAEKAPSANANETRSDVIQDPTKQQQEQQQGYTGKGKGKAVEVEDAPDPDAGS